ncbi:hypothetical protein [Ensifer adhaerens]|uniref:hypothetical protein n=1 Tax=Ensifer adhaerens TaxID=106592 RepID=UPI003001DE3D
MLFDALFVAGAEQIFETEIAGEIERQRLHQDVHDQEHHAPAKHPDFSRRCGGFHHPSQSQERFGSTSSALTANLSGQAAETVFAARDRGRRTAGA